MHDEHPRIVVAGSGVAALEALLALHELAGHRIALELIAPGTATLLRAAAVATPFGLGGPGPIALADVADRCGARWHSDILAEVRTDAHEAVTARGEIIPYDQLIVAVGAREADALPGTIPFGGPQDVPALDRVLDDAARGAIGSLAFAVPSASGWTLPAYELAIMSAVDLRARGASTTVHMVTAEPTPLWLFGEAAAEPVAELLAARGITLHHGRALHAAGGALHLAGGETVPADAVVVVPPVQGPWIQGLPTDAGGFLVVDGWGRVEGAPGVWAAGDATAFPVKQGGLACQQADTVAEAIAAELGARPAPPPFRPILRGLLLTGGAPLYLRAEIEPSGVVRRHGRRAARLRGEVSSRALWWPPGKVAGRYLAPYVATARPQSLRREPMEDRALTASAPAPDAADAVELALLLADADAEAGDYAQALHALDAAAALAGGVLPAEAARRRDAWRPRVHPSPVIPTKEEP